jgi:digeranylgeranylglycerophospholipid reductase
VDNTDVVVVGAGPAGLLAAREVASRGLEVKVLEEHNVVGVPNHCAGLLSVEGLARLDVELSPDFVQNEIYGGRIYSPGGEVLEIPGSRTRAYVIDRTLFDRYLAASAQEEGAAVETGRRVVGFIRGDAGVEGVRGQPWSMKAQVVIDAEGAGASLARGIGFAPPSWGVLQGVNMEVSNVDVEPHMVEVWLGRDFAPGLFAWVIPLGERAARCGLACRGGAALSRLRRFLANRFSKPECSSPRSGVVLTGGPVGQTYGDGVLLAGDVAGQAKATTGGGVILGGLCAIEAGRTAADAIDACDGSAAFLQRYQRAWRGALGGDFSSMLSVRRLLNKMSDRRLDRIFQAVRGEGLEGTIRGLVDVGDMDTQSGVIRASLSNPRLLRLLLRCLGRMALGELRSLFNL